MTPVPTSSGGVLGVAEVLDRAADLLAQPGKWTQGAYALDRKGNEIVDDCEVIPDDARCYCLYGAIAAVARETVDQCEAANWLSYTFKISAVDWNDTPGRTQAEVVAALRSAATAARTGEKA